MVWKRLLLSWGSLVPLGILLSPAIAAAEWHSAPETSDSLQHELRRVDAPPEGAIAPSPAVAAPLTVDDSVTLTPLADATTNPVNSAADAEPHSSSVPDLEATSSESPEQPVQGNEPAPAAAEDAGEASDSSRPTSDTSGMDGSVEDEEIESVENSSDEDPEASPTDEESEAEELTAEELEQQRLEEARLQLLIQADRLLLEGRVAEAEALYRQAKPPIDPRGILAVREGAATTAEEGPVDSAESGNVLEGDVLEVGIHTSATADVGDRPAPYEDPTALPPAASVYWREALAGRDGQSIPRTLVALKLLTEQYPEFIPGHTLYAQVLREQEQPEDAAEVLERATSLYPNRLDLALARVQSLELAESWLQASLAARQFGTFNPDHPESAALIERADENLERFRRQIRSRITNNTIANAITGAISYAATGTILGPLTALDSALLLLRGESSVGENVANSALNQLDMVEDPEVVEYVNSIGQELAALAGRDEFEYEFYVVDDETLNAFALPGGKIFVHSGAIMKTNSEAELAGLLAHELAHAVLSHGFQMITTANMASSILQTVPNGDLFTALTVLDYSRDMERQADDLGTRILASAGYAADGLYNLMVTLDEENGRGGWSWLSSHPATIERVYNIATQIQENGYNRYTYEGVERHQAIQVRLEELAQAEEDAEAEEDNPETEAEETPSELPDAESNPNLEEQLKSE